MEREVPAVCPECNEDLYITLNENTSMDETVECAYCLSNIRIGTAILRYQNQQQKLFTGSGATPFAEPDTDPVSPISVEQSHGVTTLKCPECGATLNVEEGRTQCFCAYCGAKIMINNENEHIYRHIDEAKIRESENRKQIRMKELEMAEAKRSREISNGVYLIALSFALWGVAISLVSDHYMAFVLIIAGALLAGFNYMNQSRKGR